MASQSLPRTWMSYITPMQRENELAYRRAVLRLPITTPRQDHSYPEFFTTGVYMIWHAFTMEEEEYIHASFPDFEFHVRKARAGKWLRRFLARFVVRFPVPAGTTQSKDLERRKTIVKIFINALAGYWATEDGRPQMKDGRMDVMTVRLDILHEYVDDFEVFFTPKPEGTEGQDDDLGVVRVKADILRTDSVPAGVV